MTVSQHSKFTSDILFRLFLDMAVSFTLGRGQANISRVSATKTNIFQHILSRSITGRGTGLQLHFVYKLHLVWNTDTGQMCM
jgi:hypothetical protein